MIKYDRIIVAYSCEERGSETGFRYYWTKAISTICKTKKFY